VEALALSVLLSFAAFSILDVSKAVQKHALALWRTRRLPAALIWTGATLSTTASIFLTLYAVSLGSVVVVGAMAGSGLASLTLFSRVALKETMSPLQLSAVGAILAAPFLIVLSGGGEPSSGLQAAHLLAYLAGVSAVYGALLLLVRSSLRGILLGGFAGAFGGFIVLFQKASTTPAARALSPAPPSDGGLWALLLELLANPFSAAWILLSVLSALVVQFSYRHAESFRIVPVFDANNILISIIGGLVAFQTRLQPLQWAGVGMICAAVFVLVLRPPKTVRAG
jgi:drug/metabolite transporter (DMT)-like permease